MPPVAGDDIDVSSAHNETTAAAIALTFPGTNTNPNRILSCDKTNAPAQASDILAGAVVNTTGASNITLNGCFYMYGVSFLAGSAASTANIIMPGSGSTGVQYYAGCFFQLNNTSASSVIQVGGSASNAPMTCTWGNTTVRFGAVGQSIQPSMCVFKWQNTASAINASGSVPTNLFSTYGSSRTSNILLEGIDLSLLSSATIFKASWTSSGATQILNCKLPSTVTIAGAPLYFGSAPIDLINSDGTNTNYRQERYGIQGTLKSSTTVYNKATDGDTSISWQVVTVATNNRLYFPFECFEIVKWVAAGMYAASLVNVTSATASLTNADIWVDVHSLDTSGFPIATIHTSGVATVLTAGTTLTSGSAWVSPLGGSPNNYVLSIPSFTTALDGYVRFIVKVAKPSLTVYIDPNVVLA